MSNEQEQKIKEVPAWKALDIVCRKWAVLSGLERDLSNYQKNERNVRIVNVSLKNNTFSKYI